jgi:hypothetical protein
MNRWPAAFVCGREKDEMFDVKKGGVVVIDFTKRVALGKGTLAGMYHPKDLCRMG